MQPVAKQASGTKCIRKLIERHLPSDLEETKGVLDAREGMLDTLSCGGESLVVVFASARFSSCSCCFDGELWCLVRASTAAVLCVSDIGEDTKGWTQPWCAEAEGDGLGCACWCVAMINDAEST